MQYAPSIALVVLLHLAVHWGLRSHTASAAQRCAALGNRESCVACMGRGPVAVIAVPKKKACTLALRKASVMSLSGALPPLHVLLIYDMRFFSSHSAVAIPPGNCTAGICQGASSKQALAIREAWRRCSPYHAHQRRLHIGRGSGRCPPVSQVGYLVSTAACISPKTFGGSVMRQTRSYRRPKEPACSAKRSSFRFLLVPCAVNPAACLTGASFVTVAAALHM